MRLNVMFLNTALIKITFVAAIEDTIKILDKVGNGLRHGRHPSGPEAERLGRVLRGIAGQLEA